MRQPFRLLVTSSPTWDDVPAIEQALAMILDRHPEGVLLVHGACPRGADAIAAAYAARTPGHRAEAGPGLTRGRKPDQRQHLESVYRQACRRHTAARDTHSSAPVVRPGSNAPPVNGGQVRDTLFCRVVPWPVPGYDPQQVDDLCRRVAAELDAGGSARPLIENAAFRRRINGLRYDIDAVDWFLDQFLSPSGHCELGAIAEDPWGDLPVVRVAQRTSENYAFELQCDSAWRDFGQLPGTHLWFGKVARGLTELRTAEQQTLASVRGSWRKTFSTGGRSFTLRRPSGSSSPAVAEFLARAARDDVGHYAENTRTRNFRTDQGFESDISLFLCELVDETGTPVLHTAGSNSTWRARACILFPDQRRLRFLVRGSAPANAIMTAVDQAGNKVARYRYIAKSGQQIKHSSWGPAEIIVHPSQKLTDELALALTLSANWFGQYFSSPSG